MFDPIFSIPQSPNRVINLFAKEWLNANSSVASRDVALLSVKWLEPNVNWVKINIDGSKNPVLGIIFAGGVLRNHLKA